MKADDFSFLDIIIIACFITVIFSPVAIFLMWFKSGWKKHTKIILSASFAALYVLLILLAIIFLHRTPNQAGNVTLPMVGFEENVDSYGTGSNPDTNQNKKLSKSSKKEVESPETTLAKPQKSNIQKITKSRWFYVILFLIILLISALIRNLTTKPAKEYENPYVDTDLYKLPFEEGFTFPIVHYLKLPLTTGEQILYAVPAETKGSKGDLVVTNKRVSYVSNVEKVDFSLEMLEAVSSVSGSALSLTSGTRTYYYFVHPTQMRYILATIRWTVQVNVQ